MPRDLPIGNGNLLVNFDSVYRMRDVYWPNVGKENQTLGGKSYFGVYLQTEHAGRFSWIHDDGWERSLDYSHDTMVTDVRLRNLRLGVELQCSDTVLFDHDVMLRQIRVLNLLDTPQNVRVFLHHDFYLKEASVGDTAYYDPEMKAVIHYKDDRWFLLNGATPEVTGLGSWAIGIKKFGEMEGTFRDAEDGQLGCNPISQGCVDSTICLESQVAARDDTLLSYWMVAGKDHEVVRDLDAYVRRVGPTPLMRRNRAHWKLWLDHHAPAEQGLSSEVVGLARKSVFVMRTQIDNRGAIIAGNDQDIATFSRDTYSYMWPRDTAFVLEGLIELGCQEIVRRAFEFCQRIVSPQGYFFHKYTPLGHRASSWHPLIRNGQPELPIQEDETALVIWALRRYFMRFGDVEFISNVYEDLVRRPAEFMLEFRDSNGLPLPSHDLWEERRGIHTFTVSSVIAGLECAAAFARDFDDAQAAERFHDGAAKMRQAARRYLFNPDDNRFCRMAHPTEQGYELEMTHDAANFGLWYLGAFSFDDPMVSSTMRQNRERLWVDTPSGGMARYVNDYYHQVTSAIDTVPGNPWIICTLWHACYVIEKATTLAELGEAERILEWVAEVALPSGIIAEQLHPFTGQPLSVSPLTWSHSTYLTTVVRYARKYDWLANTWLPGREEDGVQEISLRL